MQTGRLACPARPVLDTAAWIGGIEPDSGARLAHSADRVSSQAYGVGNRISLRPPELASGLAPSLYRARHDSPALGTNSDLLVVDLHHLLATAGPSLDRQHGIVEGTPCSSTSS